MTECKYNRCDGSGWFVPNSLNAVPCLCLKVRMARQKLGDGIWIEGGKVEVTETPLYKPGGVGNPPEIDRTTEDLFLRASYYTLRAHLRRALGGKMLDTDCLFRVTIVTDERLKNVFVGNESYAARSRKDRDYLQTMNSMGDLIGIESDLVVILLGYLGHTNKAAPGLLKEALMLRAGLSKPTWVAENTDILFQPDYPAYSPEVVYYMDQRFETVELEGFEPAPQPVTTDPEDVGLDDPPPPPARPRRAPEPREEPASTKDDMGAFGNSKSDDMGAFGGGKKKRGMH